MDTVTVTLNRADWLALLEFCDRYGDVLGSAGCNDFELPATPEHRDLLTRVEKAHGYDDPPAESEGMLCGLDWMVLGYVADEVRQQVDPDDPAQAEESTP